MAAACMTRNTRRGNNPEMLCARASPENVVADADRLHFARGFEPFERDLGGMGCALRRTFERRAPETTNAAPPEGSCGVEDVGGRQEARTPDLRVANAALSQLS